MTKILGSCSATRGHRVDCSLFAHEGEKLGVCFLSAHLSKLEVSHTAKDSGKTWFNSFNQPDTQLQQVLAMSKATEDFGSLIPSAGILNSIFILGCAVLVVHVLDDTKYTNLPEDQSESGRGRRRLALTRAATLVTASSVSFQVSQEVYKKSIVQFLSNWSATLSPRCFVKCVCFQEAARKKRKRRNKNIKCTVWWEIYF